MTAAAVSATSLSIAVTTGTATITPVPVKLAALITPANSTSQIFASSTYYGIDWSKQYGQPQVVPFFLGPQGIVAAVDRNGSDPKIAVLSSGWGAGQTSTALAIMAANHDPAMNNINLVILDNNTNRAGGGFWTTYWMFAPLLLTSAAPTPSNTSVPVVDAAYEYNVNSDAPTYPINVLADANSLAAYGFDYGAQSTAPMPAEALQPVPPGAQHYHYVVAPDGAVVATIPVNGNITYVTFESNGLPLVRPLRLIPGGNIVADAVEPTLTTLVNWGYQDNSPIPVDPGVPRPMGLLPPASQDISVVHQLPASVQQGAQAAQNDLPLSTGPVFDPLSKTVGTNSPGAPPPGPKSTALSTLNMTGGNKFSPGSGPTGTPSPGGGNPVQQVVNGIGGIGSLLGSAASGLTNGGQKGPSTTGSTTGPSGSSTAGGSVGSPH